MRFFCMLCLLSLLGACFKPAGTIVVEPLDDVEFRDMAKTLRPQMEKRGLLDADGAWYSPRFSFGDKGVSAENAGDVLLRRLSPTFRFPGLNTALPTTFQGMLSESAKVTKTGTSFTVLQGLDKIYVSLLAVTDWNHDGKNDWLVLCRIEPQNTPGGKRDYYLAITDLDKPVLMPEVIAIRDCVNKRCQIIATAADPGLVQDSPVTEMNQGQESFTLPPAPGNVPQNPASARPARGKGASSVIRPPAAVSSGPKDMGEGLSRESLNQ